MANLTKEDIRSVIETIKELYLEDMIPWICGYSGGKDSTAVVQLVWYALQELPKEKLKKTVHVTLFCYRLSSTDCELAPLIESKIYFINRAA